MKNSRGLVSCPAQQLAANPGLMDFAGIKRDPTGGVREVRAKRPMASTDRVRCLSVAAAENWLVQEEEEGRGDR